MRRIRLTESQFNQLVAKCVKKALNEAVGTNKTKSCNGESCQGNDKPKAKDAQPKKKKAREWRGNREELDDLIGGNPMDFDMGEVEGYY